MHSGQLRVPRPPGPQGRVPPALDRAHQRRVPRARHLVLALRRRAEGRRDRGRPQDPRRPRGARLGRLRRARHHRARGARSCLSRAAASAVPRARRGQAAPRAAARPAGARVPSGAFVVEGPRAVDAALDRGAPLEAVYFGPRRRRRVRRAVRARSRAAGVPSSALKEGVLEKVGTTRTPQPVLAVAPMPARRRRRARRATAWCVVGVGARRSRQPRHDRAQRRGGGRGGNRARPRIGRRLQSQGRSGVGRCDLRDPGGRRGVGRVVRGGGARRAR